MSRGAAAPMTFPVRRQGKNGGKEAGKVEKDAVKLTPCSIRAEEGRTVGSTREAELQGVNNGGRPWRADSGRGIDQTGLGKGGE